MDRLILLVMLGLLLFGCGPAQSSSAPDFQDHHLSNGEKYTIYKFDADGRTVTCLYFVMHGGFSCDWSPQ